MGFSKNDFVIKEEIKTHGDKCGEAEGAGALNEIIIEWEVECGRNIEGKIINESHETEDPSEEWTNSKSDSEIPGEEFVNTGTAGVTFFPSDFGMEDVGENGSDESGDEI